MVEVTELRKACSVLFKEKLRPMEAECRKHFSWWRNLYLPAPDLYAREPNEPNQKRPKAAKKPRPNLSKDKRWIELRARVLAAYGEVCMRCASTERIQVDHIKPKYRYPELVFEFSNLQVLCWDCNKSKSFFHETDYRKPEPRP